MMWGRYDDDDVTKLKLEVSRDYNSASGGASYLLGGIKRCIADPLNHIFLFEFAHLKV